MKLVRADGHQQQQWALANSHVQTVARILSEHMDDNDLLPTVALVLRNLHGEDHKKLAQELASIRTLYQSVSAEEDHTIPGYVIELLQTIHELYHQPRSALYSDLKEQIDSLRGAVLEQLAFELIKHRYGENDECANSRRFFDRYGKVVTLQEIDLAALSHHRRQLEGYECKLKARSIENHDCVDLAYLYRNALEEDYQAQVGVISLDPSRLVERRLRQLSAALCIHAFGVDALDELQYSPFER
jgi:hypothetical protein